MKKKLIILFLFLSVLCASAQESTSAYHVLRLPVSAHVAALGGESNTVPDDDAALAQHNPALLADITPDSSDSPSLRFRMERCGRAHNMYTASDSDTPRAFSPSALVTARCSKPMNMAQIWANSPRAT